MSIWQGDVFFRRIIELILRDVRQNPWLIDDILSDFITDPMLSGIYGQKEIENAKKWITDNEISVFLPHRMDLEKMPCVTIAIGTNMEDRSLARMADLTHIVETLDPAKIGKVIPYVISPFAYTSYDQITGFFEVPNTINLLIIQPGMAVINPQTGAGFIIVSKSNNGFSIAAGTAISFPTIGIIPEHRIYKARREIATFQENISIGCHVHGDPNALLWLYSIMMYGLLRYREGLIESRNFQISNLQTTDMIRNDAFQSFGENVYSRFITITGQVENTWIKAPKRVIEAINIVDGIDAGLIIINKDDGEVPDIIDPTQDSWVAKTDPE
jgi:hypothetical protein